MQALGAILDEGGFPPGTRLAEIALRAPVHRDAQSLFGYWRSGQNDGDLIVGRDLPSRRIASLLPFLALFEFCADGRDFRVRLAGFSLIRHFGRDLTGRHLREMLPVEDHTRHRDRMAGVMRTGAACSLDLTLDVPKRALLHFETLAVRALAADRTTPLVLTGYFFYERPKGQVVTLAT